MTLPTRNVLALVVGLLALGGLVATSMKWTAASAEETCCKEGDTTPPTELVAKFLKGQLLSPYPDYAKLAKDDPDLVKKFRLPGCNECHGGTGGGGICPALTQGVWFWGNTDDVLFRLVTLGSAMAACTHQCRPWA
jgi:mono/diheme cytochrome c family protein